MRLPSDHSIKADTRVSMVLEQHLMARRFWQWFLSRSDMTDGGPYG